MVDINEKLTQTIIESLVKPWKHFGKVDGPKRSHEEKLQKLGHVTLFRWLKHRGLYRKVT